MQKGLPYVVALFVFVASINGRESECRFDK